MELIDLVLEGIGYLLLKAFNRIFRTKIVLRHGGLTVTGIIFVILVFIGSIQLLFSINYLLSKS